MRRINRKNGCLAVATAAFLAVGSLSSQSARADNIIFNSNGFETTPTPGYTAGDLAGQPVGGSTVFGMELGTPTGSGQVETTTVDNGAQAVGLTRTTGTNVGYSPLYGPNGVANGVAYNSANSATVTATSHISFNSLVPNPMSDPNQDGPMMGVALWGNNGASELGFVGIDMTTGEFVFLDTNLTDEMANETGPTYSPFYNSFGGDPLASANPAWYAISITANFATGTVSGSIDGNPFSESFADSATSFYSAYMAGYTGAGDDPTGSATAFFDDYEITGTVAPSSVPEPASLSLAGVGVLMLLGRRARRGTVA